MAQKPDFLLIGASKAGTTSFVLMLEQHPQIRLMDPREPNFFSVHYEKGWNWYAERFPPELEGRIFGEKSATYTNVHEYPEVAERVHQHLPEVKLMYLVRHPIVRIESRWMQDRASGGRQSSDDFNNDVRRNVYGIVDTTRYLQQIDVYRRYFPDSRIKVVFFEELVEAPKRVMAETFAYLSVDASFQLAEVLHTNPSVGKREDTSFLQRLRPLLPEDTRNLPIPKALRRAARSVLKRPVNQRPRWEASTLAWLRNEIGDDTRTFLRRYRNDANYWKL